MKLLVAIKSCARDLQNGSHECIRKTWGQDLVALGTDVRFFVGSGNVTESDEVLVSCDDSYHGLPFKVKRIVEWSVQHDYDFTFLADNDTYALTNILRCGFEKYDYSGRAATNREQNNRYQFAHGGWGYFVSRNFAGMIATTEPKTRDEDRFVGRVAADRGIELFYPKNIDDITFHFPTIAYNRRYHPETNWQDLMHRSFHDGNIKVYRVNPPPGIRLNPGQVQMKTKQGKIVSVSPSIAQRMLFRGEATRA